MISRSVFISSAWRWVSISSWIKSCTQLTSIHNHPELRYTPGIFVNILRHQRQTLIS
jgi:hypothetical protein